MFQMLDRAAADAERACHGGDDRAGQHERQRHQHQQDQHHQRDEHLQGAQLPDRPALGRLVDHVGGAHERADVAGGRPQRDGDPDDTHDPRRTLVRGDRLDRTGEGLRRGARADLGDDLRDRLGRRLRVAHQADQSHERDQRRKQRQQPVVGQRGRPIAQVVLAELGDRAPERREQRRALDRSAGAVVVSALPAGLDLWKPCS